MVAISVITDESACKVSSATVMVRCDCMALFSSVPRCQSFELHRVIKAHVVLALFVDVQTDLRDVTSADRESAVAALPGEIDVRALFAHPPGACAFNALDDIGYRLARGQLEEQVNVIIHTAYGPPLAASFVKHSTDLIPEARLD